MNLKDKDNAGFIFSFAKEEMSAWLSSVAYIRLADEIAEAGNDPSVTLAIENRYHREYIEAINFYHTSNQIRSVTYNYFEAEYWRHYEEKSLLIAAKR